MRLALADKGFADYWGSRGKLRTLHGDLGGTASQASAHEGTTAKKARRAGAARARNGTAARGTTP